MSEEVIIHGVNVSGFEHLTEIEGCWLSTADYLPYKKLNYGYSRRKNDNSK